jgi:hypothetical protein
VSDETGSNLYPRALEDTSHRRHPLSVLLITGRRARSALAFKDRYRPDLPKCRGARCFRRAHRCGDQQHFMKELSAALSPGSSTLFMLLRKVTPDRDRVLEDLKGTGANLDA